MESVNGVCTLPANVARLIISVPISQFHNIALKAAGVLNLGGADVATATGLPMGAGDVAAWNHLDFRSDDSGNFNIYGIAPVETTITYLMWRK